MCMVLELEPLAQACSFLEGKEVNTRKEMMGTKFISIPSSYFCVRYFTDEQMSLLYFLPVGSGSYQLCFIDDKQAQRG